MAMAAAAAYGSCQLNDIKIMSLPRVAMQRNQVLKGGTGLGLDPRCYASPPRSQ